jgi:hypothetical protein
MATRWITTMAGAALMVATAAAAQGVPRNEPNRAARQAANQAQRQMQQMQRRQQQMQPQRRPSAPSDFRNAPNVQPNIPRNVPNANAGAATNPGPHTGSWLREHQNDTPQQMEQALRSDPGFQRLPAQRQEQLLKQLQNFSSRPPQQREQMLSRMETLESFSPEQRQQVRQVWEQFRDLPPDRKRQVHQIYQHLLCMNPTDRQALLSSDRFRSNFSEQERGILNGALNFGVPVNGGAQPNCAAGPQSFNMPGDELLRPELNDLWAALHAMPSLTPASYTGGGAETLAAARSLSSGSGAVSTNPGNGSSAGSTAGSSAGSGSGNGHFGVGSQRFGPGAGSGAGDSNLPTEQLIQQVVADALQRVQVECSVEGSGNGSLPNESRLPGIGGTFEADLQRLLARTRSEPDGAALAQQIVHVLVAAIQSRQDERANAACVNHATQLFTAEIERILGVRHAVATGGAVEAALN